MFNRIFCLGMLFLAIASGVSCTSSEVKQIDRSYLYDPPFEKGKRFLVSQAFNGNKTHKGLQNKYAVDIVMPIGTQVCAARSGVVIERVDSNRDLQGNIERSTSKVNYVKIKHNETTSSIYAHLKKASITVNRGQKIEKGQCFSQSGNSGYSTGPHLHFSVLSKRGKREQSIPFVFSHPKEKHATPRYLVWLYN